MEIIDTPPFYFREVPASDYKKETIHSGRIGISVANQNNPY
jgi:hypothetical protein